MTYPDLYGAFDIARAYCGFSNFPNPKPSTKHIMWQHGVEYDFLISHAEMIFGAVIPSNEIKLLVSNKSLESLARGKKSNPIHSIGLPIAYLPAMSERRMANSLLVFPGHGVPGSSISEEINKNYAKYILSSAHKFQKVEVCVFGPDFDRKAPIRGIFEEHGFKIIRGVDDSKFALHDQKKRILGFSHVTSNVMGSHIPYAASYGCRVSIAGPIHECQREHLENIEFYKLFPIALDIVNKYSETSLKSYFPWLFCEPHEAKTCEVWGNDQIGFDCKLSPMEMCRLFEWTIANVLKSSVKLSEKMRFLFRYARN
jgi:hypothetical protein